MMIMPRGQQLLLPVSPLFMLITMVIALLLDMFQSMAWLGNAALQAQDGIATCYALAFALVVLAFIEHGFLVVPWQDSSLFRWALRDAQRRVRPATSDSNGG